MTRKQRKALVRIIVSLAVFLPAFVIEHIIELPWQVSFGVFLAVFAIAGYDIIWNAIRGIIRGQVFDENFLMSIATVGAFCVGEFAEGAAVMVFYQIGEWFQSYAVGKSRRSIAALMDIRPDTANVEKDGAVTEVDPEEVSVDDVILVKPGERIPLDGVVIEGASSVDMAALTGESVPVEFGVGDSVISGGVNGSGILRIRVTKRYEDSTVARILELTENAASKKAKAENFITKFARYYTPVVVILAAMLALLPPLILGGGFGNWIHRGLIFLVISCPCALVISVPLSFFGGIGGAGKRGILVKGGCYLETLAKAGTVVFDKTGTLTKGTFKVTRICPETLPEPELLEISALAEAYSDHPIARSVREAYGKEPDLSRIGKVSEVGGKGVIAVIDGKSVAAGNLRLMEEIGCEAKHCSDPGTAVHIAVDGSYAGHIVISDEIKDGAKTAIAKLHDAGVQRTVMLTGDRREVAEAVAAELGITEVRAELLPGDKVDAVEGLIGDPVGTLVFVGDGINDAPVLARADVGVAMGAIGSDAAIEAADIVLMDDDPEKLAEAIRIADKTVRIVKQNIVFALAVKIAVMILGALGLANMWAAVFADVGVSVIAILNAMRAMRVE